MSNILLRVVCCACTTLYYIQWFCCLF